MNDNKYHSNALIIAETEPKAEMTALREDGFNVRYAGVPDALHAYIELSRQNNLGMAVVIMQPKSIAMALTTEIRKYENGGRRARIVTEAPGKPEFQDIYAVMGAGADAYISKSDIADPQVFAATLRSLVL